MVGVLLIVAAISVAAFPWGWFRSTAERQLSDRFGRPVTIGAIERLDAFSFDPRIAIRDVRIPQPAWAGPGDLARVGTVTLRIAAFPLLFGRLHPSAIALDGMRLALVRDAQHRENWRGTSQSGGKSHPLALTGLVIADSRITYRDAVQNRSADVALAADPHAGLRVAGSGMVWGQPVRIAARGAPVERTVGRPWPFHLTITGGALGFDARGTADAPLDFGHLTFDVTTHATDLKLIDALIEVGLFGTQPVRLAAHVRHDSPDWTVTKLAGTIGRSDIAGHVTAIKRDGRTKVTGAVVSNALQFDDLASDTGAAQAIALEQAIGLRLVPDTRINIAKIDTTDLSIDVTARHLVGGRRPSSFTSLAGHLTLDHQLLTASPLVIGLTRGAMKGSVRVDQRGGRAVPLVTIDLRLTGGSVAALLGGGGGDIDAPLDAYAHLVGPGSTIREAVGRSDGRIGVFARDGALPAKIASLIGFDVGRELFTGSDERAGLRCVALGLAMRGGQGRVDPLVIDTTRSQSRGEGVVSFPGESVSIRLTGAPKDKSVLRLPGAAFLGGTIRDPHVTVPPQVKSVGNVFKALGRAITGREGPEATDADCTALRAKVLG